MSALHRAELELELELELEKRRRLALVDPAANIGFSGVISEPQRPRGHFGSAVLILLYFFRVRILGSSH